jgi:hypothetical protein
MGFIMSNDLIITVKEGNNAYMARCNGKSASSTASAKNAALHLAVKLFGIDLDLIQIKQLNEERRFYSKWQCSYN